MTGYIRSYCASALLLFGGTLLAFESSLQFPVQEKSEYRALFSMQSELKCAGHLVVVKGTEQLKGDFRMLDAWQGAFPIAVEFVLEGAEFAIRDGAEREVFNLETPTTHVEINELKGFKGRPVRFSIVDKPPFISFSDDFLKQYGEMKIFRYPIFGGFLGECLYTLFEISRHSLKLGEGFEIVVEKGEGKPYQSTKTCVVKEVSSDQVVVEVTTIVDRQKIYLSALEPAVVTEQSRALWTIERANGFKFKIEESGHISQMIRLEQVEVLQNHVLERQITSIPID